MNGENDQSRRVGPQQGVAPKPAVNPRPAAGGTPFPESTPGVPARRRAKPPPGIISAGGVDMARAHASNIRPAADTEHKPTETAKVVLSIESDPRRVRTIPRLDSSRPPAPGTAAPTIVNGKASPWAKNGPAPVEALDRRALPSANVPRDTAVPLEPKKEPAKEKTAGGLWLRIATVVVILLLVAGVIRRLRLYTDRGHGEPTTRGGALIPPPLPPEAVTADPTASAAAATKPGHGQGHAAGAAAEPSAEGNPDEAASASAAPPLVRIRPPKPPPPPTATFTPLFEMPGDK